MVTYCAVKIKYYLYTIIIIITKTSKIMKTITTTNGSKIEMSKEVFEIYTNGGFMSFYDDNNSKELIIDGYGYSSKSTTFRGRVDLENGIFRANTNIHKFVY